MNTRWFAGLGMAAGAALILTSADGLTRTLTRFQQSLDTLGAAVVGNRHALGPTLRTHIEAVLTQDAVLLLGLLLLVTSFLVFRRSRITIAPPHPDRSEPPLPAPPRDD